VNCNQAYDLMMKFLDGELTNSEHTKLIYHINKCSNCCEEFQEYSSIVKALEEDNEIEPPDDFEMTVMNKIEQAEANSKLIRKKLIRKKRLLTLCFLSTIFVFIGLTVCSVFLKDYILEIMKYAGIPAGISYKVYGILYNFAYKVKILFRLIYCFNSLFGDIYFIFVGLLVIAALSKIYKTKEIENKSENSAHILTNE